MTLGYFFLVLYLFICSLAYIMAFGWRKTGRLTATRKMLMSFDYHLGEMGLLGK